MKVRNLRTQELIVNNLEKAETMKTRLIGLMGRKNLSSGHGLWIKRSGNSIHTCFMRFNIDVLFVSHDGEVKYLAANVKPWRIVIAPLLMSTDCLELPGGTVAKTGTQRGDKLRVEA